MNCLVYFCTVLSFYIFIFTVSVVPSGIIIDSQSVNENTFIEHHMPQANQIDLAYLPPAVTGVGYSLKNRDRRC